jgi:hypothetical protein
MMFRTIRLVCALALLAGAVSVYSQYTTNPKTTASGKRAVLWEPTDVPKQDTFAGPGNLEPDLRSVTFLKEEKGGYSTKYRIRDAAGQEWVAKIGKEAQSETAAVRLLGAIGYKTDYNYLVPRLMIPGKGVFTNVRLEARPEDVKRGDPWKWGSTPFERTREMQGLKLMMAFINNWDMKSANNVVLETPDKHEYAISDLGVSFGKTGSNGLPLFWRAGRSRNDPQGYANSKFVKKVKNGKVSVVFNGKNRSRMHNFTTEDARWLAEKLGKLSDRQIRDIFRAANYSPSEVDLLTRTVKDRIRQLQLAGGSDRYGIR